MIELAGRKQDVDALVFSPDGRFLAVGGSASHVQLWDLASGEAKAVLGPKGPHRAVVFLADGHLLTATGRDGCVRVAPAPFAGASGEAITLVNYLHAAPTLDRRAVVLVGQYNWGRYLERRELPDLRSTWHNKGAQLDALPFRLCACPDGRMVVATDSAAYLLDPASGEIVRRVTSFPNAVPALAVSPDGTLLAVAAGKQLKLCEVATGVPCGTVHNDGRKHFTDVAFHPSGRLLAASSNNETVRLFDAATLAQTAAFDWQVGPVRRIAFAPDGMRAAAAGKTGRVVVWDVDL